MPLNRPPLDLAAGPSSVPRARRWVTDAVSQLGRAELTETSELGVSELVTNAVLHGEPPISLRLRGTRAHPRVEVRDASQDPPVLPPVPPGRTDLPPDPEQLVTVGRGLEIVARCADAWGAEIDTGGKVMWFAPARTPRDEAVPGTISGTVVAPTPATGVLVSFQILDAPVHELTAFSQHYRELSREVRLLTIAHGSEYPVAERLSEVLGSLERILRGGIDIGEAQAVVATGQDALDLSFRLGPDDVAAMPRFLEILDFADDFCHQEKLLSLARSPEQREFQTWFFTEFDRQARGEQPRPWPRRQSSA